MKKPVFRRIWFRTAALMLCALLLMSSAAADGFFPNLWGQATATPAPAFSFRGGVAWDMSRQQVRAAEPALEMIERSQGDWSILYPTSQVEVSRYRADLVYMFYGDRLKMINYDFGSSGTSADYAYLTGALDAVYGDHTEADSSVVVSIMDQINSGYYSASSLHSVLNWTAGSDTWIYLYYYSQTAYGILYVNAGAGTAPAASYVTTGL